MNLIPFPYRVAAGAVGLLLVVLAVIWLGHHQHAAGVAQGSGEVQAKWDAQKAAQAVADTKIVITQERKVADVDQKEQSAAVVYRADHDAAVPVDARLRQQLAALRARPACPVAVAASAAASDPADDAPDLRDRVSSGADEAAGDLAEYADQLRAEVNRLQGYIEAIGASAPSQ